LTEEVPYEEIAIHLQLEPDTEAASHLVQAAKDHGGSDNITTVIVSVSE
jgi:PPM family protein phosphatase